MERLDFSGLQQQQQQQQQQQFVNNAESNYYDSEEEDLDDIQLVEPLSAKLNGKLSRPPSIQLDLSYSETVLAPKDVPVSDNWRGMRLAGYDRPNMALSARRIPTPKTYDDQQQQRAGAYSTRIAIPRHAQLQFQSNNFTPGVNNTTAPLSPSSRAGDLGNSPKQDQRLSRNILVDLTSNAFVLDRRSIERGGSGRGMSVPEMILGRCVKAFGIEQEDLCFYELKEVAVENIPEDCCHVGVAVRRSGFSLSALEEILTDNRRLQMLTERSNQAFENLQIEVRQKSQEVVRAQLQSAEHEAELRRLRVYVQKIEQDNQMMRSQLSRSENLRNQAQKALDELKRDFESFTQDISLHPSHSNNSQRIISGFQQTTSQFEGGSSSSQDEHRT